MTPFTLDQTLGDVLDDADGRSILVRELGDMVDSPMVEVLRPEPLDKVLAMVESMMSPNALARLKEELIAK